MSQHIHAFTIVVPSYDNAISFYVDILGFELISDLALSDTKRWVLVRPKGSETNILLAKADGDQQSASIGNQTGGRVGFFLHTNDFDIDYLQMKSRGVQFEEAPRDEVYGKVVVWQDPFGNRWDLLQLK